MSGTHGTPTEASGTCPQDPDGWSCGSRAPPRLETRRHSPPVVTERLPEDGRTAPPPSLRDRVLGLRPPDQTGEGGTTVPGRASRDRGTGRRGNRIWTPESCGRCPTGTPLTTLSAGMVLVPTPTVRRVFREEFVCFWCPNAPPPVPFEDRTSGSGPTRNKSRLNGRPETQG